MRKCECCGMEKDPDDFYGRCGRNGKKYDLVPGSYADLFCKDCVKEKAGTIYRTIGERSKEECSCRECGKKGNYKVFARHRVSSSMAGFPTFCKSCDSAYTREMRAKWPEAKQQERKEYLRQRTAAYREKKKLEELRKCYRCSKDKPLSEYRKTCSEPFKHKWLAICKVCEHEKIMIELVGST